MKLTNNILILQKEHEIQDQHCRCADMSQSGAYDLPTQLSKLLLDVDGGRNGAQQIYFNVWGTCVAFSWNTANLPKANLLEMLSSTTIG